MLTLRDLRLTYGDFHALDGVDLDVGDGEIVCVLGPSGSGKSSLLRVTAGLEPDATGTVSWGGRDLRGVPAHRRGFGLMFQDHALFPHRDVLGNVSFGLRMQGVPRAECDTRARAALGLVGLEAFGARRITELSGGEQQRVALARSLAAEPRLLMLDEPLGALDRALRDRLVTELRALFTRLGLSILFVTHDHGEAFALADRLVVMHEGRIEQQGPPGDVWRRPANAFVARFLGWNVTTAFATGPGPELAVRPDDLCLVDGSVDGTAHGRIETAGTVAGRVAARTFHGERYLVEVAVDGHGILRVGLPVTAPRVPDVGDEVRLAPAPGAGVPLDGR
jgi:thiamine transport system ATP-binding protein